MFLFSRLFFFYWSCSGLLCVLHYHLYRDTLRHWILYVSGFETFLNISKAKTQARPCHSRSTVVDTWKSATCNRGVDTVVKLDFIEHICALWTPQSCFLFNTSFFTFCSISYVFNSIAFLFFFFSLLYFTNTLQTT